MGGIRIGGVAELPLIVAYMINGALMTDRRFRIRL
jgi:hypothetical protein